MNCAYDIQGDLVCGPSAKKNKPSGISTTSLQAAEDDLRWGGFDPEVSRMFKDYAAKLHAHKWQDRYDLLSDQPGQENGKEKKRKDVFTYQPEGLCCRKHCSSLAPCADLTSTLQKHGEQNGPKPLCYACQAGYCDSTC